MNRRSAISALIASLATPAGSQGQTARRPRIGWLTLAPLSAKPSGERLAFLEQLAEFGYVDGKTVQIINRSGGMDADPRTPVRVELVHGLRALRREIRADPARPPARAARGCRS
ncbi:MAG: hypothetical protein JSW36_09455, partial [Burkholderiales bacterium]